MNFGNAIRRIWCELRQRDLKNYPNFGNAIQKLIRTLRALSKNDSNLRNAIRKMIRIFRTRLEERFELRERDSKKIFEFYESKSNIDSNFWNAIRRTSGTQTETTEIKQQQKIPPSKKIENIETCIHALGDYFDLNLSSIK